MREVAVVSTAVHQVEALTFTTDVQLMVPLVSAARDAVGITQDDVDFTCSGSSDFLAGQAFSFVHTLDAVGAVPPISESHVEMDGAFALYEAWVKLQTGEADVALVYSYGKSSPGCRKDVLAAQLDPYVVGPLWPDAHAIAALQARVLLESGAATPEDLAMVAVRSQRNAVGNPNALRSSSELTVSDVLAEPVVADPLRPSDLSAESDGGCAVVLAAGNRARSLCERPAWITGIDHRIDPQALGLRDLTRAPSAAMAAQRAGVKTDRLDVAELHVASTAQAHLLVKEIGLSDGVLVDPSGGSLAADTLMASGLVRIAEVASRISSGEVDRGLAHASSGPCLQQNLICVLEGD
ncbi:MAG: lipid-transfer protein [Acidimicrobiaceae bacterium]|nr:lipid-transfer protein [Acidimicrobiaceae bacterium]|tara:strand:+ start:139 stop:1194 length:1056 start_codon:yes stop_codon:yes gene_type:complete